MQCEHTEKITLHLFLGMPLTAEWRMHLNLSPAWKQIQIAPNKESELRVVVENGKEYLACSLHSKPHPISDLQKQEELFRKKLNLICPKQDTSKIPLLFFVQLFIA